MDEVTRENLFNRVRDWTLEAGALIREKMYHPLTIDTKSNPNDLVTQMDQEVEFFFANNIKTHFPHHSLLSEEGYGDGEIEKNGTVWIIDPIDGTMNFVHQKKNFAISVGVYHQGVGQIGMIYDVMNNNLYSAMRHAGAYKNNEKLPRLQASKLLSESIMCMNHHWLTPNRLVDETVMQQLVKHTRGSRAYGSAALSFVDLAEGAIDAYMTMGLEPWDVGAGRIIVHEVGGVMTDITGSDIDILHRSSVLVCHPSLHKPLLEQYLLKANKNKKI